MSFKSSSLFYQLKTREEEEVCPRSLALAKYLQSSDQNPNLLTFGPWSLLFPQLILEENNQCPPGFVN